MSYVLIVEVKKHFPVAHRKLATYCVEQVLPNANREEKLSTCVRWLHGRKELNRYLIGRSGNHVWISRRNGDRVAVICDREDPIAQTPVKRTKRQLTIECLNRLIAQADKQIEVLTGFDDPLAKEMSVVRGQLENRCLKLRLKEQGVTLL